MRALQVALCVVAALVLVASAAFVGSVAGDALWRAGVAALLLDAVCIMLWPRRSGGPEEGRGRG
ncbi:MAG: hypothetical protein MUE90_12580 [Thermoanaerobaculales bacterium]|jgi:hypothetical protein|nr:hypothetical protein [Thermoanaerobaculales bacterium]